MGETSFYVVGALFAVYVGAATWCSRDAGYRLSEARRSARSRRPTIDRRIVHWWRARRRVGSARL